MVKNLLSLTVGLTLFLSVNAQTLTIANPVAYSSGAGNGIDAGDIDGDGDLDIVTAETTSFVATLRNNGNGAFTSLDFSLATVGSVINSSDVKLGDMDGDGDLDIVLGNYDPNTVAVVLNNGNGTFPFPIFDAAKNPLSPLVVPSGLTAGGVLRLEIGDIDFDGDLDVALVGGDNQVAVLTNNGSGLLNFKQRFTPGPTTPLGFTDLQLKDLDKDGDLDIVSVFQLGFTWVSKNDGLGNFGVAQAFDSNTGSAAVLIGDVDNNGTLDAVVANVLPSSQTTVNNTNPAFTILKNDETGTLTKAGFVSTQAALFISPNGGTLFDFNWDGNLDTVLISANPASFGLRVLQGNGTGTGWTNQIIRSDGVDPRDVVSGDFNRDGRIDFVIPDSNSNSSGRAINVYFNTTPQVNLPFSLGVNEPWTFNPYFGTRGTFFSDVTGDGKADAIVVNDSSITVRRSNTTGFPVPPGTDGEVWANGVGFVGDIQNSFADVTGDGKDDAIVVNNSSISVLPSDGTLFAPPIEPWTGEPYFGSHGTYFADVDGDGKADAIVVNDGSITVRRSTGTRFGKYEAWTGETYLGSRGNFFADVNGDGKADAIVVTDQGIFVRLSTGQRFGPASFWSETFFGSISTHFADLDGDRRADVVVVNPTGVTFRPSRGNQFGVRQPISLTYFGSRGTFFADVDGNRRADIIVVNDTNVSVRRGN